MTSTTAALPYTKNSFDRKGNILVNWITSTDHKTIAYMYLITSFVYFCIGGVMASPTGGGGLLKHIRVGYSHLEQYQRLGVI